MASSSSASPSPPPPPPPPPPPWVDLPPEITATIFHKVGGIEILTTAQKVCTTWRNICKDPATWRVIDFRKELDMTYDVEKMCRHAVDLSRGQLVDINIECFGSDDLLAYIAKRSGQLRSLRIFCCFDITGEGLTQVARKFPLLEELHLYDTYIRVDAITAFGCSCPLLRSLKLNNHGYEDRFIETDDEEALAVAASMPNLRHLQLFGNEITNEGLTAILDGCPQLESLDLRYCFNLNLGGKLGTRCSQQIRDLRTPYDSTKDYAYISDICDDDSSDEGYSSESSEYLKYEEYGSWYGCAFPDMEGEYFDYGMFYDW